MNNIFRLALVCLVLSPSLVLAAGKKNAGRVDVWESGDRQYMQGTMNVRYNSTIAGTPYIGANGYAGSTVSFFGRDSDGEYFSCYVTTANSKHKAFERLKNSVRNGSRIYAYKNTGNNECINVSVGAYSYYLN